jgi:regulator of sirC expression with transglutaminase-like and TPR domain
MQYTAPAELVEAFAGFVRPGIEDEKLDLVRASLMIARTEYPNLDIESYVSELDRLAGRVARSDFHRDKQPALQTLNYVLFEEIGLRGNRDDYYDPRNSFLNDVLERGLGIPITLSVVYMEVARRIGIPLSGVGMPGHFLLKHYDIAGEETLIDCFNRGEVLSRHDCQTRLDEIYSGGMTLVPEFLHPIGRRQILIRMLNNLKTVYFASRNFRKALLIADLLLVVDPQSGEEVKQRAFLRYNLGMNRLAAEDLNQYLAMSPDAPDAEDIRHMLISMRRISAQMN